MGFMGLHLIVSNVKYIFRVQNTVVFMNKEWPGYPAVICQNLICVGAGVLCAIYYDRVSFPISYGPYVTQNINHISDRRLDSLCRVTLCCNLHVSPTLFG